MAELHIARPDRSPIEALPILREGAIAGLCAGVSVALLQLAIDSVAATPLRTPAILAALSLDTGDLGPRMLAFTLLHLGIWLMAGWVGALLLHLSSAQPRVSNAMGAVIAFVFVSVFYLSFAIGLPRLHLWLGTGVGGAVLMGILLKRHPRVVQARASRSLTVTTLDHLDEALCLERRLERVARTLARQVDSSELALAGGRDHRIASLEALVDHFGLQQTVREDEREPPDDEPLADAAATLERALEMTLANEREAVSLYDRFLAVVDEPDVRRAFLHLREESAGRIAPRLERAIPRSAEARG